MGEMVAKATDVTDAIDRSGTHDPNALVGYAFAVRSERQHLREVQVNLAYRWFCGLGIEDNPQASWGRRPMR